MDPELKSLFLLDPEVIFLNHGSFGATPRPVFKIYQEWQRRLEQQPVQFLGREFADKLLTARDCLGTYFNSRAADLVFIPNATYGVNVIARSLQLQPGDEILTTDHEYGACDKVWTYICQQRDARYIRQPINVPFESETLVAEQLLNAITPRTRLIFLSHITSPTALRFPVEIICQVARQAGILSLIDGAHAPGQIPLDLPAIGADFYTGNCHKWMMSPKGAAFLYAHPEVQNLVKPLVISWGWEADAQFSTGSVFIDHHQWTGTHDPAAALSVPAAINFQTTYHWDEVRAQCHALLESAVTRISELTGLAPLAVSGHRFYTQMASLPLPPLDDVHTFQSRLYKDYKIEIPCLEWNGQPLLRISLQGYNQPTDIDRLVEALTTMLPG